jgi:hypothetical protein
MEPGCSPIREEQLIGDIYEESSEANLKDSDEELNDEKNILASNFALPTYYGKKITLDFGSKSINSVPSSVGASKDYIKRQIRSPFVEDFFNDVRKPTEHHGTFHRKRMSQGMSDGLNVTIRAQDVASSRKSHQRINSTD